MCVGSDCYENNCLRLFRDDEKHEKILQTAAMNRQKHHRILLIEDDLLDQRAFKQAAKEYSSDFEYDIASSVSLVKSSWLPISMIW